jgi:hypothetical protein
MEQARIEMRHPPDGFAEHVIRWSDDGRWSIPIDIVRDVMEARITNREIPALLAAGRQARASRSERVASGVELMAPGVEPVATRVEPVATSSERPASRSERLAAILTLLLPPDQRGRYLEEFAAEVHDLTRCGASRRAVIAHILGLTFSVFLLQCDMRMLALGARLAAAPKSMMKLPNLILFWVTLFGLAPVLADVFDHQIVAPVVTVGLGALMALIVVIGVRKLMSAKKGMSS